MSAAAAAPAKPAAKPRAPRKEPVHPTYAEMVKDAIASLKERSGSSLPAISKVPQTSRLHCLYRMHSDSDARSVRPGFRC